VKPFCGKYNGEYTQAKKEVRKLISK